MRRTVGSLEFSLNPPVISYEKGLCIDVFHKDSEWRLGVMSKRIAVNAAVSVLGKPCDIKDVQTGFVQNVISQDIAFCFGDRLGSKKSLVPGFGARTLPLCDSRSSEGGWYDGVNVGERAVDGMDSNTVVNVDLSPPVLSDKPGHEFDWVLNGLNFSHARGHTQFSWWIIARVRSKPEVLAKGGWKVNWAFQCTDFSNRCFSLEQEAGVEIVPGTDDPVVDPPYANGQEDWLIKPHW